MRRIIIIFGLLFLMSGCTLLADTEQTEETLAYKANYEIIGKEKDELIGDPHPELFEPSIKELDFDDYLYIEYKARKPFQLSTGRYEIRGTGTGYVYLYDENGELVYREYMAYGMEKIEVDIKDSYDFRFNGLESVLLVKIEPELKTELTPGIYEVGTHIPPGEYEVTGTGFGYIKVFSDKDDAKLFEVIGDIGSILSSDYYYYGPVEDDNDDESEDEGEELDSITQSIITFTEGQKVIISGISKVSLNPLN